MSISTYVQFIQWNSINYSYLEELPITPTLITASPLSTDDDDDKLPLLLAPVVVAPPPVVAVVDNKEDVLLADEDDCEDCDEKRFRFDDGVWCDCDAVVVVEDAGVLILVVVVEEGVEGVVLLVTPTLMLAPLEREGVVGTDEDEVLLFLRGEAYI